MLILRGGSESDVGLDRGLGFEGRRDEAQFVLCRDTLYTNNGATVITKIVGRCGGRTSHRSATALHQLT